jgi:hypothetical protein
MSSGINPVLPLGLGPIPYISLLFVVLFSSSRIFRNNPVILGMDSLCRQRCI